MSFWDYTKILFIHIRDQFDYLTSFTYLVSVKNRSVKQLIENN